MPGGRRRTGAGSGPLADRLAEPSGQVSEQLLLILAGVACAIGCFLTWVRVADGARLIVAAKSADGGFVARALES